ncbi:hypothetical protein O6H91_08G042200 [Diphasiastrum complanatum]|uniref:Uncharacterized protein n=2 Tax=Diphasiastrum complanatum TaxID=34168 RepID=A0ACC2CWK7_DIPCM|nr:hypothetical protein O6H91_08G038100 [Diphasiastrum complanatum]KAJ7546504.1 hypothetical protein O6H91_08G042200 [Diphasiastrum complanatum]
MDPRAFVRVSIGALGLRIAVASKAARAGVHASSSPCFCEIRLPYFSTQTVPVPLISPKSAAPNHRNIAACFYLDEPALLKLLSPSWFRSAPPRLEVVVFTGLQGSCCGVSERKLLGTFSLPVSLEWAEGKTIQLHAGWTSIGQGSSKGGGPAGAELHLNVKVEADPRYIFQFDGDPALSPQVLQIQGSLKQPIFSCKFSRDRGSRLRFGLADTPRANSWAGPFSEKEKERKERKGWLVMIHDLSGSPVAAASMVTPFVPSTGSDKVSRSNPGAWLILRPDPSGVDSWQPWGRLEAWRERGKWGLLGLRFQLVGEGGLGGIGNGIVVSECVINCKKGGEFLIDTVRFRPGNSPAISPVESPHSSGDCSFNLGLPAVGGFVMNCNVHADGKKGRPLVQLAMRHVTCVEDAAVFLALSAAVDLSIDACQPFSRKMRKEFLRSESSS